MQNEIIILIGGLIIGAVSSVFGGGMFLAIPLWQFIFPQINYGKVIGNIKVGSFFRGLFGILATRKEIHFKSMMPITIIFTLSSIVGSFFIASLDQKYLFFAIVLAIILSEFSPKIAHLINKKTQLSFSILLGIYNGLSGAGIGILLPALLRTSHPHDHQIVHVKIQAQFIETVGTFFAILFHFYYGNILFPIWIIWSIGMSCGGYIGSHFLKKSLHFSGKTQRIYLWIIYLVALLPFLKYL